MAMDKPIYRIDFTKLKGNLPRRYNGAYLIWIKAHVQPFVDKNSDLAPFYNEVDYDDLKRLLVYGPLFVAITAALKLERTVDPVKYKASAEYNLDFPSKNEPLFPGNNTTELNDDNKLDEDDEDEDIDG